VEPYCLTLSPDRWYRAGVALILVPLELAEAAALSESLKVAASLRAHGADMIEWRLDAICGRDDAHSVTTAIIDAGPALLTCRSREEGGVYAGGDDDFAAWLQESAMLCLDGAWIDIEHARWERSSVVRAGAQAVRAAGGSVLCSFHDFDGRPVDLRRRAAVMQELPVDAVKLVWQARTLRDCVDCRELLAERVTPMIALCMGPAGIMTRVMAGAWGALATFAAASDVLATASGQPTLDTLTRQYRFSQLGPETRIFGLLGDPIGKSPGFVMHNAAFDIADFDGVYLPLPVAAGWESLKATMATLLEDEGTHLGGVSITLPHKVDAIRLIKARRGAVSVTAAACHAVNTLTVDSSGAIAGDNTDGIGIIKPLTALGAVLMGGHAAVLGAGGAARAAVSTLVGAGASADVFNRTLETAGAMVSELSLGDCVRVNPLPRRYDIVVQATSVGMANGPLPQGDAFEAVGLSPDVAIDAKSVVLETIYDPLETPFVLVAKHVGCGIATGRDMWLAQAAAQQAVWTGKTPPVDLWK
jgi:3-dehydroquinate dehydratase/shikimate dehydrogenase